jgi:inner membrane protein
MESSVPRKNLLLSKLIAITFLIGVSLVASFSVLGLGVERSQRADEAIDEISSKWGRAQTLSGPIMTIPIHRITITSTGEQIIREDTLHLLPHSLVYNASLETETRSRGIFDAAVYTSAITGTGTFRLDEIDMNSIDGILQWNKAALSIGIPDTRGIGSSANLTWDGKKSAFMSGVMTDTIGISGISSLVQIQQPKQEYAFSFELPLRGSQEINFVPVGKTTEISLSSNWPSPSFTGEFLPGERELSDTGFSAHWSVSSFGRSLPQSWVNAQSARNQTVIENMQKSTFGVSLLEEGAFYTEVNRAVKYSVLFIVLTFLAFFMFEVLSHLRIHPLNYLLIGLAIALFYLLLLSLSEHIGFLLAYIISTLAITGLITTYAKSVLKAKKRAGIIATFLILLYSYLYVLLQLDELSLIFGSVFLFGILAVIMYLTRNTDWYAISERGG